MGSAITVSEQAAEALRQSNLPPLRRIAVEQQGETVILTGLVQTYYFKQMAQETVLPVLNGHALANRVTVVGPS